jgi:hypothetical protein
MTDYSVIWTPLAEAFTSIDASLTFILIFGFCFLFSMQIIAWVTPPRPKPLHAVAGGISIGALNTWAIYTYWSIAPAIIKASMVGVYGNSGRFWIICLIILMLVFIFNAIDSWKKNKPLLEVFQ